MYARNRRTSPRESGDCARRESHFASASSNFPWSARALMLCLRSSNSAIRRFLFIPVPFPLVLATTSRGKAVLHTLRHASPRVANPAAPMAKKDRLLNIMLRQCASGALRKPNSHILPGDPVLQPAARSPSARRSRGLEKCALPRAPDSSLRVPENDSPSK